MERKFIVDGMLGRLARWLRLLGYDTLYENSADKNIILNFSRKEGRLILTRSRQLADREKIDLFLIKSSNPEEQLKEVIKGLNLKLDEKVFFSRCSLCNLLLRKVDKEDVKDRLPPYVYKTLKEFSECPNCHRLYWEGSHWQHIRNKISNYL